jgi:hypothetical protein
MAERRMFAKSIVLSDAFLDMPLSARCLYFTLGMFADDDGFVNSPKGIMRQCGASIDDLNILMAKKFILSFESGVIVIKHWRINNYLRNDRYQETKYIEEKEHLNISENGSYSLGIPSIGQESTEQGSIVKSTRFVPPTLDEIKDYCLERNNNVDPNKFYDFYQAKGWMVGKNKMKDWKAAIRTWENRDKKPSNQPRDMFQELRDC